MTDLSIVLISWRMRDMLERLLESVFTLTQGITFEIIVIDNDSRDGTAEMVAAHFPACRLILNEVNKGVAPARNQGLALAQGRYIVTLDADMVLQENSLARLVSFMDATPDAGIAGCKLVFEDGTVQPSGRRFPTPMAFLMRRLQAFEIFRNSRILHEHEMTGWDRNDTREVDYLIGACQCIRREAMERVGLLDDHIFYGPEDIDYCVRMRRAGWNIYYVHDTRIVHYEQRITRKKLFSRLSWVHLKAVAYLFWKYGGRLD
ncbi:MAG: glycosyltransferase family 2 protein [Ignavibacteriae bacterium]|nr:glycosyltransferase family 2 protein [Ignavibacteriota bacterium]